MQLNPIEKFAILSALDQAIARNGATDDPLKKVREMIDEMQALSPCRECLDFDKGYCGHWKQNIPPEWLEIGCDNWLDDVPF